MDKTIRTHLDNIRSPNKDLQNQAYAFLMEATAEPVDWVYEGWDELVASLTHKDNKTRAIAAQVLANLVQSDHEDRILADFETLLNVTRDKRFVTARHCMQSIWKVGLAGPQQQAILLKGLEKRFHECVSEKNCTLIRYDILKSMRELYDRSPDPAIREKALALIETEEDPKYRKKYSGVWKSA
jgi:hypothetical protein